MPTVYLHCLRCTSCYTDTPAACKQPLPLCRSSYIRTAADSSHAAGQPICICWTLVRATQRARWAIGCMLGLTCKRTAFLCLVHRYHTCKLCTCVALAHFGRQAGQIAIVFPPPTARLALRRCSLGCYHTIPPFWSHCSGDGLSGR